MRKRQRSRARVKPDLTKVYEALARVADTVKELHRTDAERRERETEGWTEEK
jgi:hypothetical protein